MEANVSHFLPSSYLASHCLKWPLTLFVKLRKLLDAVQLTLMLEPQILRNTWLWRKLFSHKSERWQLMRILHILKVTFPVTFSDPSATSAHYNNFSHMVYYKSCLFLLFLSFPFLPFLSVSCHLFSPVLSSGCSLSLSITSHQLLARSRWILPLAAHLLVLKRNANDSDSGCRVWRWNLL